MRKVVYDFRKPPAGLDPAVPALKDGSTKAPAVRRHIQAIIEDRSGKSAKSDFYSKKTKPLLRELYFYKCAYCESSLRADPDSCSIDHFRPKGVLQQSSLTPEEKKQLGLAYQKGCGKTAAEIQAELFPGYYWLSYEWSNLIPTCRTCNRSKSNHFPIAGKRALFQPNEALRWYADSKTCLDEKPLLLHPAIDDPSRCLKFLPNGEVRGIDAEGRGTAVINTCDLNRDGLVYERKQKLDKVRSLLKDRAESTSSHLDQQGTHFNKKDFQAWICEEFEFIFQKIREDSEPEADYSSLLKQSLERPDAFYLKELKDLGESPLRVLGLAFKLLKKP